MMEEIPNLPMKEKESPDYYCNEGRKYGLYQIEKQIDLVLENIEKAKVWSEGLEYPYPESHAIWEGKKSELIKLKEHISSLRL